MRLYVNSDMRRLSDETRMGTSSCRASEQLGLLQTQFAERLRVTQAAVSRWESGDSEPSPENYIRMANLADDTNCLWFWEQAGVDVYRIKRLAVARESNESHTRPKERARGTK